MVGPLVSVKTLSCKELREVADRLVKAGWELRAEGHKATLYCPCEGQCTTIPVPCTPGNPGNAARRIARRAKLCPLPAGDPRRSRRGGVDV
ncbi:hypothetical protein DF268_22950 [Streptomyces sp. V2]|nr:hypothetical protein DF268_22950 [Streptomyces sp. V2]